MSTATNGRHRYEVEDLRARAAGREVELLQRLGGLTEDEASGRGEVPCPKCGGTTRFRHLLSKAPGAVRCNQCKPKGIGDIFGSLMWLNGWTFPETCKRLGDEVGATTAAPSQSAPSAKPNGAARKVARQEPKLLEWTTLNELHLRRWVEKNRPIKVEAVKALGGRPRMFWWAGQTRMCVAFPTHRIGYEAGLIDSSTGEPVPCTYVLARLDGKDFEATENWDAHKYHLTGRNAWLWPGPREAIDNADVIFRVEGISDLLAAISLLPQGWLPISGACGAGALNTDFSIFAGKAVIANGDGDIPGQEGVTRFSGKALAAGAASMKNLKLHDEVEVDHGRDLRDWINDGNGTDEFLEVVDNTDYEPMPEPEAAPELSVAGEAAAAPTGNRFPILSSAELAAADLVISYLCENVLVAGQPMIIAGPMKTLKTSVVIALAIALAIGAKFLGAYRVPKAARVLIMSGESGLATLREIADRVCAASDCKLADLANLFWSDLLPWLSSESDLAELEAVLRKHEIDVLVVDPAFLAMDTGDSAGNLFAMGKLLAGLANVCRETGCTPILLHHAKKGGLPDNEPLELQHIAWSGFAEFARQWILLSRRERYEPGSGLHRLWLNIGGSAGHNSLHALDVDEGVGHGNRQWGVTLADASGCRQEKSERRQSAKEAERAARDESLLKKLVGRLMKHPAGETVAVFREWLGVGPVPISRAIALGLDQGDIEACEISKPGRKSLYSGYRIPSEHLTETF